MHNWCVDIIGRAAAAICCITEKHMQDGRRGAQTGKGLSA